MARYDSPGWSTPVVGFPGQEMERPEGWLLPGSAGIEAADPYGPDESFVTAPDLERVADAIVTTSGTSIQPFRRHIVATVGDTATNSNRLAVSDAPGVPADPAWTDTGAPGSPGMPGP